MEQLKIYVYGAETDKAPAIVRRVLEYVRWKYIHTTDLAEADLAVAPLLTAFLTDEAINTPRIGTLVFHPSLLPRHRGADAIKWAFALGETYSGVTWFWPDSGIDTGDICEQEVLAILPGETPREYYNRAVIPAAMRTLQRVLWSIQGGVPPRRVAQIRENGSYEPRMRRE